MEVPMYQSDRDMLLKAILQDKDTYSLLFESKHEQDAWFKRVQESTAYQPLITEIKEEAERLLNEPMQELSYSLFKIFSETGSRLEYERVYLDRKSTRLNSSHVAKSYAVFCLKNKNKNINRGYFNIIHKTMR